MGCRVPEGSPHRRANAVMATEAQGLLGKHQAGSPSRGLRFLPDFPREVKRLPQDKDWSVAELG